MNPSLDDLVRDGSLDVACALRALERRSKVDWKLVTLDDPHFANATRDCGGKPRYVEETNHAVATEYLRAQPTTTLTALIGAKRLSPAPSGSLTRQQRLLQKQSAQRVGCDQALRYLFVYPALMRYIGREWRSGADSPFVLGAST